LTWANLRFIGALALDDHAAARLQESGIETVFRAGVYWVYFDLHYLSLLANVATREFHDDDDEHSKLLQVFEVCKADEEDEWFLKGRLKSTSTPPDISI